jgi:hypothetical protein
LAHIDVVHEKVIHRSCFAIEFLVKEGNPHSRLHYNPLCSKAR